MPKRAQGVSGAVGFGGAGRGVQSEGARAPVAASACQVKGHQKAHNYAMLLGQQAKKRRGEPPSCELKHFRSGSNFGCRYAEFSPSQMATFVSALSRRVHTDRSKPLARGAGTNTAVAFKRGKRAEDKT